MLLTTGGGVESTEISKRLAGGGMTHQQPLTNSENPEGPEGSAEDPEGPPSTSRIDEKPLKEHKNPNRNQISVSLKVSRHFSVN